MLIAIIFIPYFALISSFIIGVYRTKLIDNHFFKSENLKISVVISFRNEEKNLETLIKNLANQQYPKNNFQVIFIDDFSTDNSFEIVKKTIENNPQHSFKLLKNIENGKKSALTLGVKNADYDIIVTTDADCIHNKYWLCEIASFQTIKNCDLIIAPVKIVATKSFFEKFQEIEFLSLQASTIGSAGINNPIMCNGANLIFQKKLFIETNIKKQLASGDDMFLLHSVKSDNDNKIGYLFSENAIVTTQSTKNLTHFINQRIRWASKTKHYNDWLSKITALLVLATNISLLILLVLSLFDILYLIVFLIGLFSKTVIDFVLLKQVNKLFKIKNIGLFILPFELIYLFYIFGIAILSLLPISYKWKGRKYVDSLTFKNDKNS